MFGDRLGTKFDTDRFSFQRFTIFLWFLFVCLFSWILFLVLEATF